MRSASGRVWPAGFDDGYLMYTPDGYMSVVLTKEPRARFDNDSRERGTVDEKVRAFDSYISYGGSYVVDGDIVTHQVRFCLFPNVVGTSQLRRFAINPESTTLTLWTVDPLVMQGEKAYGCLTWRRA
jgi:hypothetical protein